MALSIAKKFEPVVSSLKDSLPHAALLHGESGVGLTTLAKEIAGSDYELIEPMPGKSSASLSISIETIRELYTKTRSKLGRQVFIIDDAHMMSLPAQNAFLKLLEEPRDDVHFILVTHRPDALVKTVRSRVQAFHVPRVASDDFTAFVAELTPDTTKQKQIQFVASGRPALAIALASDDQQLTDLTTVMRDARVFVDHDRYLACRVALQYSSTRQRAVQLVEASLQILRHSATYTADESIIDRLSQLVLIDERLKMNAQPRLQLLSYVLQ